MNAVSQISGQLLAELDEHFELVEVCVRGPNSVKLKCKMPATSTANSEERRNTSKAYSSILKSNGITLVDPPVILDGMTGFLVSGKIKGPSASSGSAEQRGDA